MIVYYAYISDFSKEATEKMQQLIPEEKQKALKRVKNEKAKTESILAWFLLYKALSEKGIENYSVSFGKDGKPYLNNLPYFFNLSHSADLVCCAFGESEVGIDAEKIKAVKDSLINKVLTEKEKEALKNKDSDFIRFWTLKESILKYKGSGITPQLYSLDFSDYAENENFFLDNLHFTVKREGEYYISVCSKEKAIEFIKVKA